MNVIKFSQKEFHFTVFKEFNNVWEKEEGSRSFIKIQNLILYSTVLSRAARKNNQERWSQGWKNAFELPFK